MGGVRPFDADRFWSRTDRTTGCWTWGGPIDKGGYGKVRVQGHYLAHRLAYALARGPIPVGLEIDHLCGNRGCINPDHLEPVTPAENSRRIYRLRTWCRNGHERAVSGTTQAGGCRQCANAAARRYHTRQRQRSA